MQNIIHAIELNKIVKEQREEFTSVCMDYIIDHVSRVGGTIKLYTKKQREKIFKKNLYLELKDCEHDSCCRFRYRGRYYCNFIFTSEDLSSFIAKLKSYGVQVTYYTILEDMSDLYNYGKHTEEVLCVDLEFTEDYYKNGFYQMCSEQGKKEYNKFKNNNKIKQWAIMLNKNEIENIYVRCNAICYYQGKDYRQIIFEDEGYKNLDNLEIFSVVLFNLIDNLNDICVYDDHDAWGYAVHLYKKKKPIPKKILKDW